jgi:hypothetical protein
MTGTSSYGVNVQLGETDGVYVDLGCVVSTDLPGPEQQFVEDKCLGQDSRAVASIPTFQNLGTMSLMLKNGQDGYAQCVEWMNTEPPPQLFAKLTFPKQYTDAGVLQATAAYAKFRAYLQQASLSFAEDGGRVPLNVTLKVNSAIEFTERPHNWPTIPIRA